MSIKSTGIMLAGIVAGLGFIFIVGRQHIMQKFMGFSIVAVTLLLAQPMAAAQLGAGEFMGASNHKTSGSVTVTKQGGQYVIKIGGNFSFDGAPDPYVAFGNGRKPLKGGLVAMLKFNKGAQSYAIDASAALDGSTQVIIWCKKYAVPLGFAVIK